MRSMSTTSARTLQLTARQNRLLLPPFPPGAVDDLLHTLSATPPRLSAEVLSAKEVGAGAGVSYGHTFRTGAPTTLLLVAIGYGHGLHRKAGNRAHVTWGKNGERLPIVGRVAMDVLVVDAGATPVSRGESVVFFGDPGEGEIPVDEWCESVGEHPFSLLASLDGRVAREVTDG